MSTWVSARHFDHDVWAGAERASEFEFDWGLSRPDCTPEELLAVKGRDLIRSARYKREPEWGDLHPYEYFMRQLDGDSGTDPLSEDYAMNASWLEDHYGTPEWEQGDFEVLSRRDLRLLYGLYDPTDDARLDAVKGLRDQVLAHEQDFCDFITVSEHKTRVGAGMDAHSEFWDNGMVGQYYRECAAFSVRINRFISAELKKAAKRP